MKRWLPLLFAVAVPLAAAAQVREPDNTISAGEGAPSIGDVSGPMREDSVPVYGTGTIGELSNGSVRSDGSMRSPGSRSMLSGPVSDVSVGPMRGPGYSLSGGSMTEWSSGAVKHDIDSPLGDRISEPLRELGPLQDALRARRQQLELDALNGATEPAISPEQDAAMRVEAARAADAAMQQLELTGQQATIEPVAEPLAPAAPVAAEDADADGISEDDAAATGGDAAVHETGEEPGAAEEPQPVDAEPAAEEPPPTPR